MDYATLLEAVGNRVYALRLQKGLSQDELGRRLNVDRSNISSMERGGRSLSFRKLCQVCEALGVTVQDFFNDPCFGKPFDPVPRPVSKRKDEWSKAEIIRALHQVRDKKFIPIPRDYYRFDSGIVGQLLEREFGIEENNVNVADLGEVYELKAIRRKKGKASMLTLYHKKPDSGLTPLELFDRFGYIKESVNAGKQKKKLFTTIDSRKPNSHGLFLWADDDCKVHLCYTKERLPAEACLAGCERLSTWDLSESWKKVEKIILVFAESRGLSQSLKEEFWYNAALLLSDIKSPTEAIRCGAVKMDLCIDQEWDTENNVGIGSPHDRGPHIRVPVNKLAHLYNTVEELM